MYIKKILTTSLLFITALPMLPSLCPINTGLQHRASNNYRSAAKIGSEYEAPLSLSMQEVRTKRLEIVTHMLLRDLAQIVESYIPKTYVEIIDGYSSFRASPEEGVIRIKKLPGKNPIKYVYQEPLSPERQAYLETTEAANSSVGLTLTPQKKFLVYVEQNNNRLGYRCYTISDNKIRPGVGISGGARELRRQNNIVSIGFDWGIKFKDGVIVQFDNQGIKYEDSFMILNHINEQELVHQANERAQNIIQKYRALSWVQRRDPKSSKLLQQLNAKTQQQLKKERSLSLPNIITSFFGPHKKNNQD